MYFIYEAITDHYKKTSAARYENICRNKGMNIPSNLLPNRKVPQKQQPVQQLAKQAPPKQVSNFVPPPTPPPPAILQQERPLRAIPPNQKQLPAYQQPEIRPAVQQSFPIVQSDRLGMINDSKSSKNQFITMEMPEREINKTKQIPFEEEQPQANLKLIQCPEGCGRKFNQKALQKHAKVCRKVFQEKRKEFCAAEQREIEEIKDVLVPAASKKQSKTSSNKNQGKPKWIQESLAFRANIKKSKGIPLTPQEEEALRQPSPDMVQCSFCNRKFNKAAAQKHIPFCEKKSKKR